MHRYLLIFIPNRTINHLYWMLYVIFMVYSKMITNQFIVKRLHLLHFNQDQPRLMLFILYLVIASFNIFDK